MRIVTVLKRGGVYDVQHVAWLARQIHTHDPEAEIVCLTDARLQIPGVTRISLKRLWRGWWSKMELYSNALAGDVFYIDLDTVITGSLAPLLEAAQSQLLSVCLTDFYKADQPASAIMYIRQIDKAPIWEKFTRNPAHIMSTYRTRERLGDQGVLRDFTDRFARWQDLCPGAVISYKVHCRPHGGKIPDSAKVICFHGNPRPWDSGAKWVPKL